MQRARLTTAPRSKEAELAALEARIRACRVCTETPTGNALPHEPRPVLQVSTTARIAICGQAPGTRVHASGRPFTDPSGDRLRKWLGIGPEIFYDSSQVAIVPMGFCFPGLDDNGGDLPPRRECAPLWRRSVFELMPDVELIVLVGLYAQKWHIDSKTVRSLTETVLDWRSISGTDAPRKLYPLPHPSWRNNAWIKRNPWFDRDLLPALKLDVRRVLKL